MRPDECSLFNVADVDYAERLLRKDLKEKNGISLDMERPTRRENLPPAVQVSWAYRLKKSLVTIAERLTRRNTQKGRSR